MAMVPRFELKEIAKTTSMELFSKTMYFASSGGVLAWTPMWVTREKIPLIHLSCTFGPLLRNSADACQYRNRTARSTNYIDSSRMAILPAPTPMGSPGRLIIGTCQNRRNQMPKCRNPGPDRRHCPRLSPAVRKSFRIQMAWEWKHQMKEIPQGQFRRR